MPLTIPNLDNRRYQDLLDEALARIPVYTPEWTNFNKSDPGVTLIEVSAFLIENLLYRCNQIPDRNRKKFLQLLNIPLQPATSARGLSTVSNTVSLESVTFNDGLELRSGNTPFFTTRGLDVLPIEARIYYKQVIPTPSDDLLAYYEDLYSSYRGTPPTTPAQLYEVTSFPSPSGDPVDLSQTSDGYLWMALLVRETDKPPADFADKVREVIAGQTLSVGIVPSLADGTAVLPAGRAAGAATPVTLQFDIPNLPATGGLLDSDDRVPRYRALDSSPTADIFSMPGVIDVTLPGKRDLYLWNNIDPLEAGVDQLPPSLDDTSVNARLITWLRLRPSAPTQAQFLWIGINSVTIEQREHISGELLPEGTGEPDQVIQLSHFPVLPGSVNLLVTNLEGGTDTWTEVPDLFTAGPEVPTPDLRLPPGSPAPKPAESKVFMLDAEAGRLQFGDGMHGARPSGSALLRASYDFSSGAAGNLGAGPMTSPLLPPGYKVSNPVRTWGGADAETVAAGEKQISKYLQHRDRLVNAADFKTIALRTPGVSTGRVEVLPNYHPELSAGQGGDAPGAVTLMLVPSFDPDHPTAPTPTQDFLDAVCSYLDPRRLITTEVFLRGPAYRGIWISIGVRVLPGLNAGPVCQAVKDGVLAFLAPTAGGVESLPDDPTPLLTVPQNQQNGWPLGKSVIALEIMAVAGKTPGVEYVQPVLLTETGAEIAQIDFSGLELPRVLGISVTSGDPLSLDDLRGVTGAGGGTGGTGTKRKVQLPVIPQECA